MTDEAIRRIRVYEQILNTIDQLIATCPECGGKLKWRPVTKESRMCVCTSCNNLFKFAPPVFICHGRVYIDDNGNIQ